MVSNNPIAALPYFDHLNCHINTIEPGEHTILPFTT